MNEEKRSALFRAKLIEQAIQRGETYMVAKLTHNIKHGDLVQMTRQGLSRQNSSGLHPKNESSSGIFIRERSYLYGKPKNPVAIVRWLHDGRDLETETRLDYLEPFGLPR